MTDSKAALAFERNRADVDRLMALHEQISGDAPGRRYGLEVLNKSAIVLLCAAWEAYCEDIVSEVVEHYVHHAPDAGCLPQALRKQIATELNDDKMRMWSLAGDGWREVLKTRLDGLKVERDRMLNTPKTAQIKKLFNDHAGYRDITGHWYWRGRTVESSCDTLDELVTLRGAIAHRVGAEDAVRKINVTKYTELIARLVKKCDHSMTMAAEEVTGKPLNPPITEPSTTETPAD